MDKVIGFIVCSFAVLMPWRMRIIFSEMLGWMVQFFYFTFYGLFNFILREIKKAEDEKKLKKDDNE